MSRNRINGISIGVSLSLELIVPGKRRYMSLIRASESNAAIEADTMNN
jgi:hypothetical protein